LIRKLTKLLTKLLTKRDKLLLLMLFLFSIFISLIETIGVSVIMPFIAVIIDFNLIQSNQYYNSIYSFFNLKSDVEFALFFGGFLIFFYIFRAVINLIYYNSVNQYTYGRYYQLTHRLFTNFMGMKYQDFEEKNTSSLTKSIINEAENVSTIIRSSLHIMTEFVVFVFIYGVMLYVNYKLTILVTIVLTINGILMLNTISKSLKKLGVLRSNYQQEFYEIIKKSFNNFKLIKLHVQDNKVLNQFSTSSYAYSQAIKINTTYGHIPRLFLEAVGFSIIVFVISYIVWLNDDSIAEYLPVISLFVIALYRLMPSLNRIVENYNIILFNHRALEIVDMDLSYEKEKLGDKKVNLLNGISIKNLEFEYEKDKSVLSNVNLIIPKGSNVGFIGESGSGKSTLIDIIMGLHKPKQGQLISDNTIIDESNMKSWRSKIGYIPQSIYLFDGTVAENVIFGLEYDKAKLIKVLKQAQIFDFLQSKNSIKTLVGDGGVLLSGGQKQRIAIARALYTDPEILVLDEATSSLDEETEREIMNEIYSNIGDKTLIIVAHRLSTTDRCDKIFLVKNGNIYEQK